MQSKSSRPTGLSNVKTRYSTAVYAAISALFLISVPALADVSDHLKSACKGDYQRYCKAYKVGTEGLRACMSRSIKRVSNVCISALVKNGDMSQAQADRVKAQKAQVTKRPTAKRSTSKKRPVRTTSRKKR
jgi:hypothetical protein